MRRGLCRFVVAWVREEQKVSENGRGREREAKEAGKVEVAPRVTVASMIRFEATLIRPKDSRNGVGWTDREP